MFEYLRAKYLHFPLLTLVIMYFSMLSGGGIGAKLRFILRHFKTGHLQFTILQIKKREY